MEVHPMTYKHTVKRKNYKTTEKGLAVTNAMAELYASSPYLSSKKKTKLIEKLY
jgi:hypothetical protein